jgi:D-aminoacyl-tRNA deacylase
MPSFLIITSTEDKASMNIREHFLKSDQFKFNKTSLKWHKNDLYQLESIEGSQSSKVYLGLTDERLIFLDDLKTKNIKLDFIIFASRHVSKTSRPSLLIHTTGNWNDNADFGGVPNDLSKTSALLLKMGYESLIENVKSAQLNGFPIDMEVTHHGPTILDKPLVFMELGSSIKEWSNLIAGKVVAESIINTIYKYERNYHQSNRIGLGFGGTHYAPNFSRILLKNEIAFSFICPKYFIMDLDESKISLMMKNTVEKVDCFVIDWKGINSEGKRHLIPMLEKFNIPILKTKDFN